MESPFGSSLQSTPPTQPSLKSDSLLSLRPNSEQILQNMSQPETRGTQVFQIVIGIALIIAVLGGIYYFLYGSNGYLGSDNNYGLVSLLGDVIKRTTNMGAKGTMEVSSEVASTIDGAIDTVDESVGEKSAVKNIKVDDPYLDATDTAAEVVPDDTLHQSKSGYCFIGTANGVRSCARIKKGTKCMSGEIFPSLNICVNPALRV